MVVAQTVRTTENLLVVAEKLAGGCRRVAVTDEEGRAGANLSLQGIWQCPLAAVVTQL